jgi:16S rRNA C1402 N4-methylase RsmH
MANMCTVPPVSMPSALLIIMFNRAAQLVNTMSEAELGRIIRDWGEEKMWRAVARRIVAAREQQPITSTKQLVDAIGSTVVRSKGGKGGRGGKGGKGIHPATRTFQALRIAVNDEIGGLEQVSGAVGVAGGAWLVCWPGVLRWAV